MCIDSTGSVLELGDFLCLKNVYVSVKWPNKQTSNKNPVKMVRYKDCLKKKMKKTFKKSGELMLKKWVAEDCRQLFVHYGWIMYIFTLDCIRFMISSQVEIIGTWFGSFCHRAVIHLVLKLGSVVIHVDHIDVQVDRILHLVPVHVHCMCTQL